MKLKIVLATLILGVAAAIMPVVAHHPITPTFDTRKEITIRGVVTKTDWTNPHTRFWVDVRNDDGTVSNWELELPPPTVLQRTLSKDAVRLGNPITVVFWRAKDGSRLASVLDLAVADLTFSFNPTRNTTIGWEVRTTSR